MSQQCFCPGWKCKSFIIMGGCSCGQATSTEVWIYRNDALREAVVAFRGTSNLQDMMVDAALALSAFSPGAGQQSRTPEEVAEQLSDEDLMRGPMAGLFRSLKVSMRSAVGNREGDNQQENAADVAAIIYFIDVPS
jgi:hypothetical protein